MQDIVLTLLLVAIAHSEAQVTYSFPEDRDITICPAIISALSLPSFTLEPEATQNDPFLRGTYVYDALDTAIMGAEIDLMENFTCTNNSAMCSKLSLRYGGRERLGRGLFTITYTASNGVTRRIHVKFGYTGLYLQNETGGMVVGRDPNKTTTANNSLVMFGAVTRRVACLENGTEAPNNLLMLVTIPFKDEECFGNDQTNSQPGLFAIFFADMNRTGQERIYFVGDADCSGERISDTFLFIFDPLSIGQDSTTTDPVTNVTPTPSPPTVTQLEVIGIGVGVGGATAIIIAGIVFVFVWYYKKKRQKNEHGFERGSTGSGTRSKLSSVSTVDGGDGPSSSPTLLINSSNGHVRPPAAAPTRKSDKLYVVKYTDSAAMIAIEETLAELNEDCYEHVATQENGFLPTYMTNIIAAGHRVIILHGSKESVGQSDDIATRWIKELESSPKFTNMRLNNVFVVYLGRNQPPPVVQQMPRLQRIPISQHPDDENSNLDPSSVAKKIQNEIMKLSPIIRLQPVAANLPIPPPGSSTGSRTPTGSTNPSPLVTRNPGAGAEHPHEHPSASSAKHSQLSLTIEDKPEDRTGQTVTSDTSGTLTKILDKTTGGLKGSNSTANTPAAARSRGEDTLESSPSAPAMIQMEQDQFEHVMSKVVTKVVEAQGKKTIQEIRKEGQEIRGKVEEVKDKVEHAEEEIKDKVEHAEEEIKDKVEHAEEEIKDKVEEQGNRLSESIEIVADEVEQIRTELQNQNFEVIQPHDDDEGGRETGDVGGASTRQDTS